MKNQTTPKTLFFTLALVLVASISFSGLIWLQSSRAKNPKTGDRLALLAEMNQDFEKEPSLKEAKTEGYNFSEKVEANGITIDNIEASKHQFASSIDRQDKEYCAIYFNLANNLPDSTAIQPLIHFSLTTREGKDIMPLNRITGLDSFRSQPEKGEFIGSSNFILEPGEKRESFIAFECTETIENHQLKIKINHMHEDFLSGRVTFRPISIRLAND